jgi:hypothetical protein
MIYITIFWSFFCLLNAWMQGRIMPAIRRTPPGDEAKEQATALHVVGTLAYFFPLLLTLPLFLFSALVALAARVALFDVTLNTAARRPAFEVGQTAATDKLLRKWSLAASLVLAVAAGWAAIKS